MSTRPSPDFDGFRDAQVTLREKFGRDILFSTPQEESFASGVQLDPETGRPYDPTIAPTASGWTTVSVQCNVVSRPIKGALAPENQQIALGWLESGGVVLIVGIEDWHLVRYATRFEYADETYEVRQTEHDYLGDYDRYLIWGRQF